MGERKEHRIPKKTAEEFLPMMEQMIKPDKVSKPFHSLKMFYSPKKGEEKKVSELFKKVLEIKNRNRVKWWLMVYFSVK